MENKDRHRAGQQISLQEVDVWYIQEKGTGGGDEFSGNHQKPVRLNADECDTGPRATLTIKEPRSHFDSSVLFRMSAE